MAPAAEDPGSKYELRHQIGRGSFGSAFLVSNKQDKADYVLKRVRLAKQTKWQRNSTLQERDLATSLRHPFIVPCVESWVVQNHTVNMIYAFCQNGDLSSYLKKIKKQEAQVDEGLMQKWLCQLLLALDYLQTQQVLHRDIKTSNLMLTCDDDVQLGDFGLATLMEEHGEESKPQDTNLVGTPHYMSPELLSCKAYGFKTDVWSLGCVFYELTAQRPTFNAFNIHGLVSKIKKNKLTPLPASYSQDWRDVVELMLCKNPDRRPSVQQLMQLPSLRPAMLEARARARQLMPAVPLPPLLDPTPLTPQGDADFRIPCGQQDVAGESEGSAGSASDQQGCGRSGGGGSEAGSSRVGGRRSAAGGLAAAPAVQASELSELWKANWHSVMPELQQQQLDTEHPEQQLAADEHFAAGLAQGPEQALQHPQEQQEHEEQYHTPPPRARRSHGAAGSSGGGSRGDADSSLQGDSPEGSSSSALTPGAGPGRSFGYSPRGALGVIDGYRRLTPSKQAHVNQPGIKRTPSERVAAAIAAAGAAAPAQQAAAAAKVATGRVTPDLCPRPIGLPGSPLLKSPRSTASSKRAPSEAPSSQQQQPGSGVSTPPGQVSPGAATPRLPSSIARRQPGGLTPRQDSSRRHRQSAPDSTQPVRSSSSKSLQAGQQLDQQGDTAAATAAGSKPARPLSAPRCSSVTRGSGAASAGARQQQQRPPWGGGAARSCLTPGRERPQVSPILKAVRAHNTGSSTSPDAQPPQAAASAAAAAGPATKPAQRRSPGMLSPVPRERAAAREAASAAAGAVCAAQCGAPDDGQQHPEQQQQGRQQASRTPRRTSSSVSDTPAPIAARAVGDAAHASTPSKAGHGLPRSSSSSSKVPAGVQQQEQQAGSRTSPRGLSLSASQHRRSPLDAAGLPPLPLHKLRPSSSKGGMPSPLPLASPVERQERKVPVERSSSNSSSSNRLDARSSVEQQAQQGCISRYAAVAPTPARRPPSPVQQAAADAAAPQQHGSKRSPPAGAQQVVEGGRVSKVGRTGQAAVAAPTSSRRHSSPDVAGDAAAARKAAVRSSSSSSSSRRVSAGSSSSSRRCSSLPGAQQQQQQQPVTDSVQDPVERSSPPAAMACSRASSSSSLTPRQDLQQPEQQQQQLLQRLELLESAMVVIGGLAQRKRWTELSTVMRSSGLMPSVQDTGLQAAATQQPAASDVLKLGDIVVLGRSKSIRGKIRYIGPVGWDCSGVDWVGMELDRPCGVDSTQRGLTYFDCPPSCASFHKASDLTTVGG